LFNRKYDWKYFQSRNSPRKPESKIQLWMRASRLVDES
jgi:hypothetical protein